MTTVDTRKIFRWCEHIDSGAAELLLAHGVLNRYACIIMQLSNHE